MEQIIFELYNPIHKIAFRDWRTVYLFDQGIHFLQPELHKGRLVYRLPGTSKRWSYNTLKRGFVRKQMILREHLPF